MFIILCEVFVIHDKKHCKAKLIWTNPGNTFRMSKWKRTQILQETLLRKKFLKCHNETKNFLIVASTFIRTCLRRTISPGRLVIFPPKNNIKRRDASFLGPALWPWMNSKLPNMQGDDDWYPACFTIDNRWQSCLPSYILDFRRHPVVLYLFRNVRMADVWYYLNYVSNYWKMEWRMWFSLSM